MGRRSLHTGDQLRELILSTATDLIETEGLTGLSARELARRIGYSPGTIYNVFADLDDILITIERRLVEALTTRLAALPKTGTPSDDLRAIAAAYVDFTQEHPKLWNLLIEHGVIENQSQRNVPTTRLDGLLAHVEAAFPDDDDPERRHKAALILWAAVHGLTTLFTSGKLAVRIPNATPRSLIDELVKNFLAGFFGLATGSR